MSEPGSSEEQTRIPLNSWIRPLANYGEIPYDPLSSEDYHYKKVVLPFVGVDLLIGVNWEKGHGTGLEPFLYFDGISERLIPNIATLADEKEREDELRLVNLLLGIENPFDSSVTSSNWVVRLRFPSGTVIEKPYDPKKDEYEFGDGEERGFLRENWIHLETGQKFDELLLPETDAVLEKIELSLSRTP